MNELTTTKNDDILQIIYDIKYVILNAFGFLIGKFLSTLDFTAHVIMAMNNSVENDKTANEYPNKCGPENSIR